MCIYKMLNVYLQMFIFYRKNIRVKMLTCILEKEKMNRKKIDGVRARGCLSSLVVGPIRPA